MKKSIAIAMVLMIVIVGSISGCSKSSKTTDALEETNIAKDTAYTTSESKKSDGSSPNGQIVSDSTDTNTGIDTEVGVPGINGKSNDAVNGFNRKYEPNTEEYTEFTESGFLEATSNPLSTFSIDVDTASYANLRKNIENGIYPEPDSIRIEEMLNYFSYDYEQPADGAPFSIHTEIGKCPWNEEHYLMMVGLQGKKVEAEELPKSNLVFLIDVSGSMDEPDKLPLLKEAFLQLLEVLGDDDKVSIVVYAGQSGVVQDGVPGYAKSILADAIHSLTAGGSTGGAEGIDLAYELAEKNFIKGGNNRIILATDGDFNVGPSSVEELEDIISRKRESGIYLSVMGFGSGNLKDNKMEVLADKGNGNYSYIDSSTEANRVLVKEMSGTLLTIAKDVKIQLEFNPTSVKSYRLIGYENRALESNDFKDDSIDAGELGAGHRVTAIYEIVPARGSANQSSDLKYQTKDPNINEEYRNEISEIRLRYKEPNANESKEIKKVVTFQNTPVGGRNLSKDFNFASAVVEFGMLLKNSAYKGNSSIDSIIELAELGLGEDADGYRSEFIGLVKQFESFSGYPW